jgi:cytochrome c551/c552
MTTHKKLKVNDLSTMKRQPKIYIYSTFLALCMYASLLHYSNDKQANALASTTAIKADQPVNSPPRSTRDTGFVEGHSLISASDCFGCHAVDKVLTAPSYMEISERYKNDKNALSKLTTKVIAGGKGVWGDVEMNPHPGLLREDVQKMIQYILHLDKSKNKQ